MRSTSAVVLALVLAVAVVAPVASVAGSGAAAQADEESQPPVEQWNRTYDSPGEEIFSSITETPDGYLLTGWTERDGNLDGWVMAVDSEGREEWSVVLGDDGTDRLYDAVRTTDGGYILAGRTDEGGESRGWLVKVDGGEVEWQQTVDAGSGAFWAIDRNESTIQAGGWTWEDGTVGWVVTVDEQGEIGAEETYRSGEGATYVKTIVAGENGTLLAGKSEGEDGQDAWAAGVATNGTVEWNETYGASPHDDVWDAAADGEGYVLAGETGGEQAERDAWALALDENGTVRWEETYGDEGHDWFDSATATDDELVFTGGLATGEIGGTDGFVVATDRNGTERWRTVVGTPLWDKPWPAVATDDGGYLLAGHTGGYGADGTAGWLVHLGPTADATGEQAPADEPSTDRETTGNGSAETGGGSSVNDVLWQPRLTALVAIAALALGVLVARR